jgi:hypothetical protein
VSLYRLLSFGWVFSVGILLISYAALAFHTSTPWLWPVIVHESGDRTLGNTILYYEHAARELPLDLILGAAIGGSALFVFPGMTHAGPSHRRRATIFLFGTVCVVGIILLGTVWTGGFGMLYENLLQFPTRPGEPLVWGGHWRYHFLSHLTLMLLSFGVAGPAMIAGGRSKRGNRSGLAAFGGALGSFLLLAALFVPKGDSFSDPVFLGHQAREVFTHALVTLPLAWSACMLLVRRGWYDQREGTVSVAASFGAGVAGLAFGMFLVVRSLMTSAASQGQSESLTVLIFPHFFEHAFSYVVATLAAGLVFEAGMTREAG